MTIETALKIGGFATTVILAVKAIDEYRRTQKWKKAEFVSKEVKEFLIDFNIKRALLLLDWNSNDLPIAKEEIIGKDKIYFTDDLITSALKTHLAVSGFTDEEVIIKSIFDVFFDRLSMFYKYIETGLINANDIKPYIIYWVKIFADNSSERKPAALKLQLWEYLEVYQYNDVKELCKLFGYSTK